MVSCIYGVIRIGISAASGRISPIIQRVAVLIGIGNAYVIRTECIFARYWIVATVGKHIVAENALSGGGICVRINKSANRRVIESGLQIIEPGLGILRLAAKEKTACWTARPAMGPSDSMLFCHKISAHLSGILLISF